MSLLLVLAAAATSTSISAQEKRFAECVALVDQDPVKAAAFADNWRITDHGGVPARQCQGLAYAAQGRWIPAATAFEQAARQAETERDARATTLWVQAGNAALAGSDPLRAKAGFDAALTSGRLKGAEAGEVHLDRARALVALRQMPLARSDLDAALKLVPADPLAWLLSATLARNMGDLKRAETDIAEAASRSPDDANVALEAGNIAASSGAEQAAKTAWSAAVKLAPESPAGKAAAKALAQFSPPKSAPALQ
jgi:tetratricopeptide (TPR) repeat protein